MSSKTQAQSQEQRPFTITVSGADELSVWRRYDDTYATHPCYRLSDFSRIVRHEQNRYERWCALNETVRKWNDGVAQ